MAPVLTRRTLAKGAAWPVPVVVAASAVPALTASTSNDYSFSGSFSAGYTTRDYDECNPGLQTLTGLYVDTEAVGSNLAGFGVVAEDDSASTTATITNFSLTYAFPEDMVEDFDITSGSYSGPTVGTATIDGETYDTFTFTWTGAKTHATGSSFTNSTLEATATVNDDYCAYYGSRGETYYFHPSGSWSTANGVSGTLSTDWIERTMTED